MSKKADEQPPAAGVPIVQPMIDELTGRDPHKSKEDEKPPWPPGPGHPPQPAELDESELHEDDGGGDEPDESAIE